MDGRLGQYFCTYVFGWIRFMTGQTSHVMTKFTVLVCPFTPTVMQVKILLNIKMHFI